MKIILFLFFFSILLNSCSSTRSTSQKLIKTRADAVNVGVYYESFDQNSINFISNQLKLSDTLLNIVNIDLVPWGRTQYLGNNVFNCTNGDEECHADRIHACATYLHSKATKKLLQFMRCTVQHNDWKTDPAEAGEQCTNQIEGWMGTWPEIAMCARLNDTSDINVFLGMKNKTEQLDPPLDKVPIITINGKRNAEAETGLKTVLCNSYNGEKPAECKEVVVGLYYESHDDRSINFIKSQLQLSDQLLTKVGVDFVPWGRTTVGNETHPFICTGGPNECHADRIHACASYHFWSTPNNVLKFIECTVKHASWKTNSSDVGSQCASTITDWIDPWITIEVCAEMNDSDDLLVFLGMRDKTNALNPPLTSVPVITINGNQSKDAENNLIKVICDKINGNKPSDCGGSASAIISNKIFMISIALLAIIFSSK